MFQNAFFYFFIIIFLYIWRPSYIPWYKRILWESFYVRVIFIFFLVYSYNLKMLFALIPWVNMLTHPVFAVTLSHSLSVFLIHVPSLSLRFILLSSRSLYPLILSFLSISVHLHSSLSLSLSLSIFLSLFLSLSFSFSLYSLSLLSPSLTLPPLLLSPSLTLPIFLG